MSNLIRKDYEEYGIEPNVETIAEFLAHAWAYICNRRPYETMTLAILNEKRWDILDKSEGAVRIKQVN